MRALSLTAAIVVTGCSSTQAPTSPTVAQPSTAAKPTTPAAVAIEPEPAPELDDLEPQLERAEVRGEGITVEVTWWTLTGSTHLAASLAITTARGTLRLEAPDPEDGEALPLVAHIYKTGVDRWVLLGWSSFGSGMQSEHAWLVDGSGEPRIADRLEWRTDRSHAGIVIDRDPKLRIGIPLPAPDEALHDDEGWALVHGTQTRTLAEVTKLPSAATDMLAVRTYTPPFDRSASGRGWSGRVVWFSVGDRFVRR